MDSNEPKKRKLGDPTEEPKILNAILEGLEKQKTETRRVGKTLKEQKTETRRVGKALEELKEQIMHRNETELLLASIPPKDDVSIFWSEAKIGSIHTVMKRIQLTVEGLRPSTTDFPTKEPPEHSTTMTAVNQLQTYIDSTHEQWLSRQKEPLLQCILACMTNLIDLFGYTTEFFVGKGRADCAVHKRRELKTLIELKVGDPKEGINQLALYLANANLGAIEATPSGVKTNGLIIAMSPDLFVLREKGDFTVLHLEYTFKSDQLPSVVVLKSRIFSLWKKGIVNPKEVNLFIDWLQMKNIRWFHGEPDSEEDEDSMV